jgi:hypothetical protein
MYSRKCRLFNRFRRLLWAVAEAAGGKAELQAGGPVQGLLLSGGQLEESARRVAAKAEFHFKGFPRVGFIVTKLPDFKPGGAPATHARRSPSVAHPLAERFSITL